MDSSTRPWRSLLYIPGSRPRPLEKARTLPADGIIFDLEDAVAPSEKQSARATLTAALGEGGYGNRARLVRVNGLDTEWGEDDVRATIDMDCDAVLVPKVESPAMLDAVLEIAPARPLWAMIETPGGIFGAEAIAAHPALQGFVMGTNDLAKDVGCRSRSDRLPMMMALQTALMAARAHGKVCVDGVYNAFKDEAGLDAECQEGRDLGMDGKSLIHPAQIDVANRAFGPGEDELELARRQIEAFDAAVAEGQGVAVVDGRIVENLHVATARALLEKARIIAELEGS